MRQIVLDTETTGLEHAQGHRIIEIGCVELVDRRLTGNNFHQYLQPDREIDEAAIEVHGIKPEFLADKPRFPDVMDDFVAYIKGADLVIHNAPFDVGFLNAEFKRACAGSPHNIDELCGVIDTLVMARQMHPGQRNSLDALCKRYEINNSHRDLHGALLDAEILADVYLGMTGGQTLLSLDQNFSAEDSATETGIRQVTLDHTKLRVIRASEVELEAHETRLKAISTASDGQLVWDVLRSE